MALFLTLQPGPHLIMLAYIGPDAVMPIASVFAAIVGFLLICWRWVTDKVRTAFRFVLRIPAPDPAAKATATPPEKAAPMKTAEKAAR